MHKHFKIQKVQILHVPNPSIQNTAICNTRVLNNAIQMNVNKQEADFVSLNAKGLKYKYIDMCQVTQIREKSTGLIVKLVAVL